MMHSASYSDPEDKGRYQLVGFKLTLRDSKRSPSPAAENDNDVNELNIHIMHEIELCLSRQYDEINQILGLLPALKSDDEQYEQILKSIAMKQKEVIQEVKASLTGQVKDAAIDNQKSAIQRRSPPEMRLASKGGLRGLSCNEAGMLLQEMQREQGASK